MPPIENLLKLAEKIADGRAEPSRVVIADSGKAVSHRQALMDHNGRIRWTVCFIRDDGWSLAAPGHFEDVAWKQWADAWVLIVRRDPDGNHIISPLLNGQCLNCGACCKYLIVEVEPTDVVREPMLMELARRDLHAAIPANPPSLDANGEDWIDPYWEDHILTSGCGVGCKFHVNGHCSIYPTRPFACVLMPVGGDQCLQSRACMAEVNKAKENEDAVRSSRLADLG